MSPSNRPYISLLRAADWREGIHQAISFPSMKSSHSTSPPPNVLKACGAQRKKVLIGCLLQICGHQQPYSCGVLADSTDALYRTERIFVIGPITHSYQPTSYKTRT